MTLSVGNAGSTNSPRSVQSRQPCSPFLMTTNLGPILRTCTGSGDQIFLLGQETRFAVVENQSVDLLRSFTSSLRSVWIQRFIVSATTSFGDCETARASAAAAPDACWRGRRIGCRGTSRGFSGTLGQDVQIDFDGDRFVKVFHI